MTDYIIIDNFLTNKEIEDFKLVLEEKYSKKKGTFGDNVRLDKKNRYEYTPKFEDLIFVDEKLEKLRNKIYNNFGFFTCYREKWKVGIYEGSEEGFYTEHRDNQCRISHRRVSSICMLSNPEEYEGGELHFPELNKKFKLDKGTLIIFNSNLLHGVKPITKGIRYVMLSFLYDVKLSSKKNGFQYMNSCNTCMKRKYMLPITPDSGPGNQIISIKEALLLSKLLNRICILPPIHSHYTSTKKIVWNFNEIYDVKDYFCNYYDKSKTYEFNNIYGCHGKYTFENLKLEKILDIKDKNTTLLTRRNFRTIDDIEELEKLDDNIICIKHLWNHVKFNTCSTNGCSNCEYNKHYLEIYKSICMLLDFSSNIKKLGDFFIKEKLNNKYIAIHIRYPDKFPKNKTLKDCANYDEDNIFNIIEKIKKEKNIEHVFIATNNVDIISNTILKEYSTYDVDVNNPINSFIEQYICCCSNYFILSRYNDYKKLDDKHIRSTWSSFVYDYRLLKNNNKNNLYLDTLL